MVSAYCDDHSIDRGIGGDIQHKENSKEAIIKDPFSLPDFSQKRPPQMSRRSLDFIGPVFGSI